ncbi:MAG: tetratricopeptide repeat protein, partial [Candidatus Kapabacteria bacterium]|nr:tetratricopeptide repeat protein [Candidatus Kapabacteria bacterium]
MGTSKKSLAAASARRKVVTGPVAYAVIAILAAVIYWQAPSFTLDKFDEDIILQENMSYLVHTAKASEVVRRDAFFRTPGVMFYRPVQNLSYLLDARIGRGKATPFYITNILLHVLASCLVLAMLRRFIGNDVASSLTAAFFAVNPLFVQAVAWTPGRGDLLMTIFAMAALLSMHRYMRSGSALWLTVMGVSTLLTALSKETGIVMAALLPASWLLLGQPEGGSDRRRLLLASVVGVLASAMLLALRAVFVTAPPPRNDFDPMNLVTNLPVFLEIVGKLVSPWLLQPMAGYTLVASLLGVVVLGLLVWRTAVGSPTTSRKVVMFGLLWYVAFLLPGAMYTHRFGDAAYGYLEHRGYAAAVGVMLLMSAALGPLVASVSRRTLMLSASAVILVMTAAGMVHVAHFASARTFYDRSVQANPHSALARSNRGQLRLTSGDTTGAISDYIEAIAAYPRFVVPHVTLGLVYLNQHRVDSAIAHFRTSYEIDPSIPRVPLFLGNAYAELNNLDSARHWYTVMIGMDASNQDAVLNLGVVDARAGNWLSARNHFTRAIEINPSS